MLDLAELRRAAHRQYAQDFFRPAEGAREKQRPHFEELVGEPTTISLVHEDEGHIDGFLMATLVAAPPVYNPGGVTCLVDDFCVEWSEQWATVGIDLLESASERAKAAGATQSVVVCSPHDEAKRAMLRAAGLDVVSEWFTARLV